MTIYKVNTENKNANTTYRYNIGNFCWRVISTLCLWLNIRDDI